MAKQNWDVIAEQEFEALDREWQNDWADLRKRVTRRG